MATTTATINILNDVTETGFSFSDTSTLTKAGNETGLDTVISATNFYIYISRKPCSCSWVHSRSS